MPLHIAFVLSLACHLALYTLADWAGLSAPPPPPRSMIEAMLILPEIAAPPPEEEERSPPAVEAPVAVSPAPSSVPPPPPSPASPSPAVPQAGLKPAEAKPPPRYYPREAVLRGLEGEVLVGVTLDRGRVVTARLERGSGHAILDEAALVAVRTLKSLPAGEREATLPVRFKLN